MARAVTGLPPPGPNWEDRLGVAGLYLLSMFGWFRIAGHNVGMGIALLAFLLQARRWHALSARAVVGITLVLAAYLMGRAWLGAVRIPSAADAIREGLGDWLLLLMFLPIAWHVAGSLRRLTTVWLLALAGLLVGLAGYLDADTLGQALEGTRTGFHLKKPIAFSLYSGTAVLVLLLLAPRCWGRDHAPRRQRWLRVTAWLVVVLVLVEAMLLTQSRGGWLGMVAVLPVALWVRYRPLLGAGGPARGRLVLLSLVGALLAGLLVAGNYPGMRDRLLSESATVDSVTSTGLESAPLTSISYRLWLWRLGSERWLERPLIGWGPGTSAHLIAETRTPGTINERGVPFDHLHSTPIELLVQLGLVGAGLFSVLLVTLLREARRAYRAGLLPTDYYVAIMSSYAFTGVWSLFDYRLIHYDWRFHFWLLAVSSVALTLRHPPQDGPIHGQVPGHHRAG